MEEKKIASLGYEELDKDIEVEIFGLKFGIGFNNNYLNNVRNLKYIVRNGQGNIKECIDTILGNGSFDKIKDKYEKDQGKEIDDFIWAKVALFLREQFEKYNKENKNTYYNSGYRRNYYRKGRRRY